MKNCQRILLITKKAKSLIRHIAFSPSRKLSPPTTQMKYSYCVINRTEEVLKQKGLTQIWLVPKLGKNHNMVKTYEIIANSQV